MISSGLSIASFSDRHLDASDSPLLFIATNPSNVFTPFIFSLLLFLVGSIGGVSRRDEVRREEGIIEEGVVDRRDVGGTSNILTLQAW